MKLIELITPYDIGSKKIRLGPKQDGGYVMNDLALEKCTALFTYGVRHDIRYEADFMKQYQKQVYLFDHTTGQKRWENKLMKFIPEGLGFAEKCRDFLDHYLIHKIQGDVLLKMDIDGNEYDYFEKVSLEGLAKTTTGLMIEFHWIDRLGHPPRFLEIMTRLNEHFILTHIHGNNYRKTFAYDTFNIPEVLELSFVNRKLVTSFTKDTASYPIAGLDYANKPSAEQIPLDWIRVS